MWKTRSQKLEILDLPHDHYSREEYDDCQIQLDKIGRWLGGDRATYSTLKQVSQTPFSLLDVGCGGGLFTTRLACRYPQARVLGIDLNPQAIQFANYQLSFLPHPPENLTFECRSSNNLNELEKFDVVLSTLVCHHMKDQELIGFISSACALAKKKVILNDLHRHPLAYYAFKLISPFLFRNRLVLNDGPLSVLRAFTRSEWIKYLEAANINNSRYNISWHWAFRWIIEINCEKDPV